MTAAVQHKHSIQNRQLIAWREDAVDLGGMRSKYRLDCADDYRLKCAFRYDLAGGYPGTDRVSFSLTRAGFGTGLCLEAS